MLTNQDKNKWIRQITLSEVGLNGQQAIRKSKVAVVGCGGLGCPALLYLAASGIGTLGLIDFDTITISNLHRQILFGNADLGLPKSVCAAKKLQALHPEVNYEIHNLVLDESNASQLLSNYDMVIDGSDNFSTKYLVNDTCVKLGIPLIYGSVLGFEVQLGVFNFQNHKQLRDIFPEPPLAEDVPSCAENGVMPSVPGILGSMLANECLKILIGVQMPSGSLHVFDFKHQKHHVLNF